MIIPSQIYIVIVYKYTALRNIRIIFLYVSLVWGFLRAFRFSSGAIVLFDRAVARPGTALLRTVFVIYCYSFVDETKIDVFQTGFNRDTVFYVYS